MLEDGPIQALGPTKQRNSVRQSFARNSWFGWYSCLLAFCLAFDSSRVFQLNFLGTLPFSCLTSIPVSAGTFDIEQECSTSLAFRHTALNTRRSMIVTRSSLIPIPVSLPRHVVAVQFWNVCQRNRNSEVQKTDCANQSSWHEIFTHLRRRVRPVQNVSSLDLQFKGSTTGMVTGSSSWKHELKHPNESTQMCQCCCRCGHLSWKASNKAGPVEQRLGLSRPLPCPK